MYILVLLMNTDPRMVDVMVGGKSYLDRFHRTSTNRVSIHWTD